MKFDAEKLEKDIDSLPGICDDGKKGIKKLFENHFGVEFQSALQLGEIYTGYGEIYMVYKDHHENLQFVKIDKHFCTMEDPSPRSLSECKKLANSPEEYFKKKFAKEL